MSSFGNRGRQPDRPGDKGKPPLRGPGFQNMNQSPHLRAGNDEEEETTNRVQRGPLARGEETEESAVSEKIEPGRRCVALIFDCIACYFIGLVLTVIPFLVHFVTLSTTWALLLLVRDWFFDGRGFGKNLMGLQVIDASTGRGCSLKQSVMRNIVILGPFAALQIISVLLQFVPFPWLTEAVKGGINAVGMVYLVVMLPVECYRAYSRDDGLRYGDQLAGTTIVESAMDFSNPFSK